MVQWSDMWLFRQPFGTKFSTEGNFTQGLCALENYVLYWKLGKLTRTKQNLSFLFSLRNFSLTILNNITTCHFNLKLELILNEQFLVPKINLIARTFSRQGDYSISCQNWEKWMNKNNPLHSSEVLEDIGQVLTLTNIREKLLFCIKLLPVAKDTTSLKSVFKFTENEIHGPSENQTIGQTFAKL